MTKSKKLLINLLLTMMLIFSSYHFFIDLLEYKKAELIYSHIRELAQNNPVYNENHHYHKTSKHNELVSINSDYRFWLIIENTDINYPVVQGCDNQYYLKHDFNKNALSSGSLFMDYRNNFIQDKSVIIYGHHMKNDTMFGQLEKFKNEVFFNKNNLLTIEYQDRMYTYEVFSAYVADFKKHDYLKLNFKNDEDKIQYLNYIKNRSLYQKDIALSPNDHIITLYTCSYEFENAKTIIHGKLIKIEEL